MPTSLHRDPAPRGGREGGRWASGGMQEFMNLVGQVSGCLRSSGRELWTPFLGQAWLIPRPGAGASLDLQGEAASPKGPDLKLCPAWLSPSGTWGHPACNYVLWQGAPVKEQRKGLINHLVSLAHSAGSLSPVVAERIRGWILKSCRPASLPYL